jgi:hypothetical protein
MASSRTVQALQPVKGVADQARISTPHKVEVSSHTFLVEARPSPAADP